MQTHELPDRIQTLLNESYEIAAASACLAHGLGKRGIVFLSYDMQADRIVEFFIPRPNLFKAEVKDMFSLECWQSILKATKQYYPYRSFCVVIPDQIDDVFYTLILPYQTVSPKMSYNELQAVIGAARQQDTQVDLGKISPN